MAEDNRLNAQKITVRDLQHMASSKEHMIQVLDMEGRLTRVFYSPNQNVNTQISPGYPQWTQVTVAEEPDPPNGCHSEIPGTECVGFVGGSTRDFGDQSLLPCQLNGVKPVS